MKKTIVILMAGVLLSCQSATENKRTNEKVKADTAAKTTYFDSSNMAPNQPANPEKLITAGKGIGHIMLGNDPEMVIKELGKPDFEDAAMGKTLMTWYANHDSTGYQTSIFCSRHMGAKDENTAYIKKIFINSPWFKTDGKIGIGSTLAEIGKYYNIKPIQAYASNKEDNKIYIDADKGIAFEVKTTDHKCVGIIVHKPHENIDVYLNMHEK